MSDEPPEGTTAYELRRLNEAAAVFRDTLADSMRPLLDFAERLSDACIKRLRPFSLRSKRRRTRRRRRIHGRTR